jgi:hypothetical protein
LHFSSGRDPACGRLRLANASYAKQQLVLISFARLLIRWQWLNGGILVSFVSALWHPWRPAFSLVQGGDKTGQWSVGDVLMRAV